jgi:uncharacterized cupin superfamily protein
VTRSGLSHSVCLVSLVATIVNLMMPPPPPSPAEMAEEMAAANVVRFAHAPLDYFGVALMTPKGPRPKADVGTPHDATRPLADAGPLSVGTWWCAAGGWPSETPRATTEAFHVFSGRGCVTDSDGKTKHYFGPGDTVVLPKGWAGRWDIWKDLHKVWFVHNHARVEVKVAKGECIQAAVTPYRGLVAPGLATPGLTGVEHQLYSLGPTNVMGWTCQAPSKIDVDMPLFHTEAFHMLEGVVFVSNADGSAQRCVAGDTVVLPRGWCGRLDVMETVRKLRVVVE